MLKTTILSTILSIVSPQKDCQYTTNLQIKENAPQLSSMYVDYLSHLIDRVSKKYNLSCEVYTAILMQESRYNLSAKNCTSGVCTDFGIGQIHIGSIRRYKLDKRRLLTDLEYSLEAGAKILYDFKKAHKRKSIYWAYYNSSNKLAQNKYIKLVSKWF